MSELPGDNTERNFGEINELVKRLGPFYSENGMTGRFGNERHRFICLRTADGTQVYPHGQFVNDDGILLPIEPVMVLWDMPELARPKEEQEVAWYIATHLLDSKDGYGGQVLAGLQVGTQEFEEIAEQIKLWAKKWKTSDLLKLEKYNYN